MERIYFIAGIDTGIGKTIATGVMARALRARGVDASTVKLVQTGNDGFSEDIDAHRRLMGTGPLPEDHEGLTAPQVFKFPSSPKLAAEREGRVVDLDKIAASVKSVAARRQVTLVEAAGGLHVPLTGDTLTIDFAAAQGWPVILVTCGRLGSLNHTLLSLEAIKARGMRLAGIVYNYHPDADPLIDQDTPAMTRAYLAKWGMDAPLVRLGPVPDDLSAFTPPDFSEIFS